MADLVLGERNLGSLVEDDARDRRRRHEQRAGLPVIAEVVGHVDGDYAGAPQRRRNVDLQNSRMRNLAAQERRMQHSRQLDVVDEQRLTGEKPAVLVAFDRLAEGTGGHAVSSASFAAADITASTMF